MRNLTQTFKKTVLAKNNTQNLQLIAEEKEYNDVFQREMHLDNLSKWDRFRHTRKHFIEYYIKLRRRQKMVMELRVIFETKRALINVYNAYYHRKLEILKYQR